MSVVLDASAVIALLRREPGHDVVDRAAQGALMSTVNLAEVVAASARSDVSVLMLADELRLIGVRPEPFTVRQAELAGALIERTRSFGLSLGDRACVALALERDLPVLTADRAWQALDPLPEVRLIR